MEELPVVFLVEMGGTKSGRKRDLPWSSPLLPALVLTRCGALGEPDQVSVGQIPSELGNSSLHQR